MEATQQFSESGERIIAKPQTAHIWKTFWILTAITCVEFAVAFLLISPEAKIMRLGIFVGLTIVKAFYIVAEFMHLKYEVKSLIYSIIIPITFVVWLLLAMYIEGGNIFVDRGF
jgi:cytochrome c oxidase subunit IV